MNLNRENLEDNKSNKFEILEKTKVHNRLLHRIPNIVAIMF